MKRRDIIVGLGGAAASAQFAARAQKKSMPMIGYLHFGSPAPAARDVAAFRQGLSDAGYIDGQNVAIEYRWAEGQYDRLPALAADLVRLGVNLIVAGGPPSARAAKDATSTIPIVVTTSDPVAEGLIASLARPGGNLTGFSNISGNLAPKRLELLAELVPRATVIAMLVTSDSASGGENSIAAVRAAAHTKGMQLQILKAGTPGELDDAFAALVQRYAGAPVVVSGAFFNSRREQIVALAARYAVAAIYEWREFVTAGGLISYGTSLAIIDRQAGVYAGRILKGEKPADLPVQQPTVFELAINLTTAKALGLTVPPSMIARADEVIE